MILEIRLIFRIIDIAPSESGFSLRKDTIFPGGKIVVEAFEGPIHIVTLEQRPLGVFQMDS